MRFTRRSGNSYKRAVFRDGYGSKFKKLDKRMASRAVRRAKDVPDGMWYKRCFNSYDICDWVWDYRFYYAPKWGNTYTFGGVNYWSK